MTRRASRSDAVIRKRSYTRAGGSVREYYEVELVLRATAAGRRERLYATFDREDDARDWADAKRVDRRKGAVERRQVPTTGHVLQQWLDHGQRIKQWSPSHYRRTKYSVDVELKPLHPVPVDELDLDDVDAAIFRRAGLAPDTLRLTRSTLRAAINHFRRRRKGVLHDNIASDVDLPGRGEQRLNMVYPEQLPRFFEAIAGDHLERLYKITMLMCLRPDEALGLWRSDVGYDRKLLSIERALQYIDGKYQVLPLKTDGSRRQLPMADEVADLFRAEREAQRDRTKDSRRRDDAARFRGYVFTGIRSGAALNEPWVNRHLASLLKGTGLPVVRFEELRHTGATLLLDQGMPLEVLQRWLGHTSILTTQRYAKVTERRLQEGARIVDDLAAQGWSPEALAGKTAGNGVRESHDSAAKIGSTESDILHRGPVAQR